MQLLEKLRILRRNHLFSQKELASKLNVSPQTISNWERGYSTPGTEDLNRLSKIFSVSVSSLLNGDNNSVREAAERAIFLVYTKSNTTYQGRICSPENMIIALNYREVELILRRYGVIYIDGEDQMLLSKAQ